MLSMDSRMEDGELLISLGGRIDSSNSEEMEQNLKALRAGREDLPVVFDCEKL